MLGVPGQPFELAVTVIFAISWPLPLLVAVNAGIFPVPLAGDPIPGKSFIQLNVALGSELVKLMALVCVPLQ